MNSGKMHIEKQPGSPTHAIQKMNFSMQKLKLDSNFPSCQTLNSKWIKDLDIHSDTLKLLQQKCRAYASMCTHSQEFLNRTPDHIK